MTLAGVHCPLCGPQSAEVLVWTKNRYRYVRCVRCGMIYINPQLTDQSVARIYSQDLYDQKSERLDLLLPGLERYKSRLLKKFERFRTTQGLLDVGCFKGFFLFSAARRGWKAVGTEVSEPAVRFARDRLGLQVELGDLLDLPHFEENRFDIITFFDVIEHLSRPHLYLQKAHRLLRPGGLLYLETPNIRALPRYLLGKRWTIFHSLHRYYFQPRTIERLLDQSGFGRVRTRTVGLLPLGTREEEPGRSQGTSGSRILEHLPIDLLRDIKDKTETSVFWPLDAVGLKVGTKMVVWAEKGA